MLCFTSGPFIKNRPHEQKKSPQIIEKKIRTLLIWTITLPYRRLRHAVLNKRQMSNSVLTSPLFVPVTVS